MGRISDLKLEAAKILNELSDKFVAEAERLRRTHVAVELEIKRLRELHDIDIAADTLEKLILDHERRIEEFDKGLKEKRDAFDQDRVAARNAWEMEQAEHAAKVNDRDILLKRDRQREQDEFAYKLKLERQRDADAYETKKKILEQELADRKKSIKEDWARRESELAARETDLQSLKEKAALFPEELKKAVESARAEAERKTREQVELTWKLKEKDVESKVQLDKLRIETLQEKIAAQTQEIEKLKSQVTASNEMVKDIATTAIEGASGTKSLQTINEIALEQAKAKTTSK